MTIRWRSAFRYPQTSFLLGGTLLGYLALLVFTRFRWVSWGLGAAIALAMLAVWFLQFRRDRITTTGDLLNATVMLEHLDAIAARVPGAADHPAWTEARQWASNSQAAAAAIAERDSTLVPDLIETLYTVEALAVNVALSAVALDQVQTEQYQSLTQQQLTQSRDRLRETHDQLQQLRDQLLLSQLRTDAAASGALPDRLQLLIDANKSTLKDAADDRP